MNIGEIRFSPEIEVEFPEDVNTREILGNEVECDDCEVDICDGCGEPEEECDNCEKDRCENCDYNSNNTDVSQYEMRGWEITEDCSLDNGLEYKPSSNNHLYYNVETLKGIKNLLKMIKSNGGYVESNCGLHIHVDVACFSDKEIANIIKNFVVNQKEIIAKFRVYQHRLNEYCHPLPEELKNITAENIKKFRDTHRKNFSGMIGKFYALNMECIYKNSYKTLEFRLFNGTLGYETMKKYIFWVLNFVITAKDNINVQI